MMIAFINLVDSSAPMKKYQRDLDWSLDDFRIHLKYVGYYRLYIQMTHEIGALAKTKRGKTTLEKAKINNEIRQLRASWRPRLAEAKK
jgi:hypothetical protein